MSTDFRFAGWNPNRGTVPAYYVSADGLIHPGEVLVIDGHPCNAWGEPMTDDGRTQELRGWTHRECASFDDGRVLVPLI